MTILLKTDIADEKQFPKAMDFDQNTDPFARYIYIFITYQLAFKYVEEAMQLWSS